jgi:hypothetical protein
MAFFFGPDEDTHGTNDGGRLHCTSHRYISRDKRYYFDCSFTLTILRRSNQESPALDAIRPFLLQAFGGAVAPRTVRGFPKRFFASMTTMAETMEGTGEVAGLMQSNGVAQQNGGAQGNGKKRKLHGRAFYESIGSPKLVLAPMVEQSEFVGLFSSVKLDLRWWLIQSF